VNRMHRTRSGGGIPSGWGPVPGWGQPLPGWSPLVDHGPLPLRMAGSVARWWWPTLALAGFGIVTGLVVGQDHPGPGLSYLSLLTVALAAAVVALLTIHRRNGPGPLARAVAEYTLVAVLAGLLTTAGAVVDQQPANHAKPNQAKAKPDAQASAGDDQSAVLRAVTTVLRAGAALVRGVTGAARWLVNLWRQADQQTTSRGEAMPALPDSPTPSALSIWRSRA
jgi:hypothetical protein